jgi:hypothetical protein
MASLRRAMLKLGLLWGGDVDGSVRGDVTGCETAVVGWCRMNASKYKMYRCYYDSFDETIPLSSLRRRDTTLSLR